MKKICVIVFAVMLTANGLAQAPLKMSYQAVIRNSSNQLVTSQAVGIKVSILKGSVTGTSVYTETQTPNTNANGLVSIEIGGKAGFDAINWADGPYFIKTETDPAGGTNYTIIGTSQILSVPYALHSTTAETLSTGITETDPVFGASSAKGITSTHISNWNTAFGWGNHATSGYLKSYTETDPLWSVASANYYTKANMQTSGASQLHFNNLTNKPTTVSGYGIADAMTTAHAANGITSNNITNWNTAFGWGNHAGLYRPINYVPAWSEITSNPFVFSGLVNNQLLKYNSTSMKWENWTPNFLTGFTETDPYWTAAIASYYTKTNMQTSGAAQLHFNNLTNKPTTVSGYGITDAMTTAHAAYGITSTNITHWNTAYGWGNHAGLYRPVSYVPAWGEITGKPVFASVATTGSYTDLNNKPTILNSQWTTSGNNIYYNTGKVGIGSKNPAGMLEINGFSGDWYPHLYLSDSLGYARMDFRTMLASTKHWVLAGYTNNTDGESQWNLNYNNSTTGKNIFSVYGDSRIAFDGDVGIGLNNPAGMLEINGNSVDTYPHLLLSEADGFSRIAFRTMLASTKHWVLAGHTNQTDGDSQWHLNYFNGSEGKNMFSVYGDSRIAFNGNVAIGMTYPRYNLTIYNDNSAGIGFYNSTSGTTGTDGFMIRAEATGSPVWIWNWENSNIHIGTNNLNRMLIKANGVVDIMNELNLHSDGKDGAALFVNNEEALWWNGTYFSWGYAGQYNYFANKITIGNKANPGYMLYVDGTAYATGTWNSSDARLKKNITPIDNALNKIMKIRGTSFEFRQDEFKDYQFAHGLQFGFIAQELEDVLPEVVNTDSNGYKAINYSEIIPVLTEAVKEQQKTIEKLEAENNLLKKENKQINTRLEHLEKFMETRAMK